MLEYEINAGGETIPKDVAEVVNYVRAMNHGVARLREFPLSLRLIREIHGVLLEGLRGQGWLKFFLRGVYDMTM